MTSDGRRLRGLAEATSPETEAAFRAALGAFARSFRAAHPGAPVEEVHAAFVRWMRRIAIDTPLMEPEDYFAEAAEMLTDGSMTADELARGEFEAGRRR